MYSDAAKVVGAEFEVAELTTLIERRSGRPAGPRPADRRWRGPIADRALSRAAVIRRAAALVEHVEQIADDAVVGDVEDRRAGILVDSPRSAPAPCIPSRCSGAPETPSAQVQLGLHLGAGLPDLADLGQPPESTTGRDAASSAPSPSASSSATGMFSAPPIPRPTQTIRSAFVRSTPSSLGDHLLDERRPGCRARRAGRARSLLPAAAPARLVGAAPPS